MTDIPMMANSKKMISPVTHPAIITKVVLKPDARDLEIIANIPGPGVTARTNIAMAKLKIETRLILIPHDFSNLKLDFTVFILFFKTYYIKNIFNNN
jgi:hypothetical protein